MCESPVVLYLLFTPCNKCVENQQPVLERVTLNLILRNAYSENFLLVVATGTVSETLDCLHDLTVISWTWLVCGYKESFVKDLIYT